MNLYSKISLLTVAGVRIGPVASNVGSIVGMHEVVQYHFLEEGSKQTIQNLSVKKVQASGSSSRFEERFSNKRAFTKS